MYLNLAVFGKIKSVIIFVELVRKIIFGDEN